MSPAEYGHIALAYTVVSLIGSLAYLGVSDGVTRYVSVDSTPDRRRSLLHSGFLIAIIGSVTAIVLVFMLRGELAELANDDRLAGLLVLFAPYILISSLSKVSFAALRTSKQPRWAVTARNMGPRIVGLLLLGIFVLLEMPLIGALGYWIGSKAAMTVLSMYYVFRGISIDILPIEIPDRKTIRHLWSFSWPLAASSSVFLVLSNADILMIGYFLDSRFVGYYRSIQPLKGIALFIRSSFAFLFFPVATEYFANNDLSGLGELYVVTTKWILSLTFPLVLVFGLFASSIVRTFFGAAYLPAAPALQILIFGMFLRTAVGMDGELIKAIDRPQFEFISAAFGVVANVVLNVVLIPVFGIAGAAVATIVGYAVYNAVELIIVYREIGTHPFSANALKPLVPTALVGLAVASLVADFRLTLPSLIAIGVLLSAVHLFSLFLTRSLDSTDMFLLEEFENYTGVDLTRIKSAIEGRASSSIGSDK